MNLNLEDYDVSRIEFKKGVNYTKDEPMCDWYDVTLNIKNQYFNYNKTHESLLESELWIIYHNINSCLNNELEEDVELDFCEPDLQINIYKSSDERHLHLVEFKIFICLNGVAGFDHYSFIICDDEVTKFRDYIGSVLNAKK